MDRTIDYYQKERTFFKYRYWDLLRYASKDKLDFVIAFVTNRCNCNCHHCLYYQKRNSDCSDMPLSEWRYIARHLGHIHNLVVSGGEPFFREDLCEILNAFVHYCKVNVIDIPTNGFNPKLIQQKMIDICKSLPNSDLSLSISIDGSGKVHDSLRDCPGSYEKALQTMVEMQKLKQRFPRLVVTAQSTICSENLDDLPSLAEEIWKSGTTDFHVFEIIRGEVPQKSLTKMDPARLRNCLEKVFAIQCHYAFQQADQLSCYDWYANIADIGEIADLYEIQYQNYILGQPWPISCKAGRVSLVIDSDGEVRACELRKSLGKLKVGGDSIPQLLNTPTAQKELAEISENKCHCTHVCFLLNSLERNLFRRMYYHPALGTRKWIEYKRNGQCSFGN